MHRSPLPILADFLFLHNLLNEKSLDHMSFEAVTALVQKKFQKNDLISVGNLLSLLIKNNDLAETNNRLVAYYLLYDIFRNDNEFDNNSSPRDSPFSFFLYQVIDSKDAKLNQVERNFIVQLLASGTKDVSTMKWDRDKNLIFFTLSYASKRRITFDKPISSKCPSIWQL
jgi:hypothetical protein